MIYRTLTIILLKNLEYQGQIVLLADNPENGTYLSLCKIAQSAPLFWVGIQLIACTAVPDRMETYGAVVHEDHVLGITSVSPIISFCANCRYQRQLTKYFTPFLLLTYSNPNLIEIILLLS